MFDQWDRLQERFDQISIELASPDLQNNKRLALQKEASVLTDLLDQYKKTKAVQNEIAGLKQLIAETDDTEMQELYSEEIDNFEQQLKEEERVLEDLLYPPNEHDNRNVYLEIRAGAGGQEAALFATDLLKMYKLYAERKNWRTNIEEMSETDLGGLREVILHIQGKNAFGLLKFESGVHRVQRVPATETQGRVHTSTATVAVLPEAKEVDVTINPADLRIDVYRASGAGGQHVNTTDSAVRITHIPTGVVVSCQDERSQHKNKAKAMKMLQSRILAAQVEAQEAKMSADRKKQVGTGMRSEKVRTYNYPQNRVTDHQVEQTWQKLDMIMQGDLDDIVEALSNKERTDRRTQSLAILQDFPK
jgi:peptide chain release factor 1